MHKLITYTSEGVIDSFNLSGGLLFKLKRKKKQFSAGEDPHVSICMHKKFEKTNVSFFLSFGRGGGEGWALSVKYYVKHSVSTLCLLSVQYTCAPIIWTFCYEDSLASFGLVSLYLSYMKLFFNVCHFVVFI